MSSATCNGFHFPTLRDKLPEKFHSVTLRAIVVSPKKLQDKLQRGHVTCCNLFAACLATPKRDKLHRVTIDDYAKDGGPEEV